MGVPAFFRWLSKKYPSIVVHCVEEKPKEVDGTKIPVNTSLPNPNDYEFDNLYLDMNGIIHPCSHPENKPAPKNEAEMMVNIFEYIDRIFSIVRPRRLLYMAIDGVAPRAKMNQQRSRRFRAAKESRESREIISNIKQNLREKGALLPPEKEKTEHFDSNCITPGTDFMDRLSGCLRYYIGDRLTNDPGWKNIKVILSDANTPGEGEHKIMDFIRHQRAQPDHDPNTKHCLNGADADLIMLGLATHEVNFTILREEFKPNQKRPCEICAQVGHDKTECEGLPKEKVSENDDIQPFVGQDVEFIFIRLNVLREYLERELKMEGLPFYNFERALDDWIFMCFFVGNDFLPHLPSLEIREGAIDRLVRIYKNCLPQMGGYLGDSGFVNMERVQRILQELGEVEDEIFRKRQQFEEGMKRRRQQNEERNKRQRMEGSDSPGWSPRNYGTPLGRNQTPMESPSYKSFYQNQSTPSPNVRNQSAASDLRMMLRTPDSGATAEKSTPQGDSEVRKGLKRPHEDEKKEEKKKEDEPEDHIRLWEEGWKERYYLHKFGVSKDLDPKYFLRFRKHVADEYVLGLCWVLQYYFQGCPSWNWFYPFHYAPFASDFLDIDKVDTTFERGTGPFKPLEQLMSVFPAASGKFLPPTWRELMQSPDSEIIDFYPTDFKIDLNGKRFAWQGVALLPFVDEKRLHRTLKKVYGDLTEDEKRRNKRDHNMMFMRMGTSLYDFVYGLHENGMLDEKQDIVTDFSNGVRGKVFADDKLVPPGSVHISPVPGQPDLTSTKAFSVRYEDPTYEEGFVFPAKILENATRPERTLKPGDFPADKKWRPQTGMSRNSYSPQHVAPGGHRMLRHELGMNRPPSPYNTPYNNSYHNNHTGHAPYNNSPRQWNSPRMAPPPWGQVRPPNFYNQQPQRGWEHRGGGHQRSYSNRDTSYQNNQDAGYQNYQRDGDRRRSFPSSNHYRR
ncbi:5'-3' exoribonuclease 2-like [Hydractinia symbiolongicarpus]|uniref:5'-3' exoribonuclease 2-like n=1 Tax=Hydractinia symbiolongicarpus TaxID=13093 RepID=UPI00254C5155|nr:5'-3' exoribonuclease 2-like [Hydractinia symbiolongicarpus]XP_057304693.1 5'-3' exoribonuclease 2-like [Hydractinia symbiolongicarpus]XP_057304694.1 5'-3' exoribonuclease 2-like [Hydractinia symbiolongicarpus]